MAITKLRIRRDPGDKRRLSLVGGLSNGSTITSSNFRLLLAAPTLGAVRVAVDYQLDAHRDLCVDLAHKSVSEDFRIARIASNFISAAVHDSDFAAYDIAGNVLRCAPLHNDASGFIWPTAGPLRSRIELVHSRRTPRNTPSLSIVMRSPKPSTTQAQGWVTESADVNADNVDYWLNWTTAKTSYRKGDVIGKFAYDLRAAAAAQGPCR